MVLTCAESFEEARREAVDNMMRAIEIHLRLEPGDALALISIAGDLRVGQAYGEGPLTLRLEMPLELGIEPTA
jgi:acetamidase/formamidase